MKLSKIGSWLGMVIRGLSHRIQKPALCEIYFVGMELDPLPLPYVSVNCLACGNCLVLRKDPRYGFARVSGTPCQCDGCLIALDYLLMSWSEYLEPEYSKLIGSRTSRTCTSSYAMITTKPETMARC